MSAMSRRTREQDELAEQLAAILREANERLRLWGRCSDTNCQRERICCGDADQCGTRVAPESWAWLRHVVQEMLAGASQDTAVEAANRARLGYRARRTVRWQVPCWDPIEFFELHDGTWVRADQMPQRPPLEPPFVALATSRWLRDALPATRRADAEA